MSDQKTHSLPDGIGKQHFASGKGVRRHASFLSILILGAIMALALSGLLGGRMNDVHKVENQQVDFSFRGPRIIRNGMFFEAHAVVHAKEPIGKLVLAVDEALMHDMTMNSMVPAAADETIEDGAFHFSYDKLEAGDDFDVKFDFQINPSLLLGTDGKIAVYDDKTLLAELPVEITVLP